ncbi:MAG: hypothetical protein GY742_10445 [Hyphomicrobiales bacterium]|nr:hypothetical protein [Hyphomicrobiales bacterium]
MNTILQGEVANTNAVTRSNIGTHIFSGRKSIWVSAFAVISLGLFIASPSYAVTANLALVLLLMNIFLIESSTKQQTSTPDASTLAGSMLVATLLWISNLAGSDFVSLLGTTDYFVNVCAASVFSLFFFLTTLMLENSLATALQFVISGTNKAPARIASLIDAKFAGFFGETR